ncbi:MAG: EamA family transporter, partial [Candidatus Zixiibacteriota bacterium]
LLVAGARFVISGLLIFAWVSARGVRLPRMKLWLPVATIGVPLVAITYGFLFWAQQTVPSGLAALFYALTPIWMVLFDWISPKGTLPAWPTQAGIGLGITGVALLVNPDGLQNSNGIHPAGAGLLLVSTICWSLGSIWSRHVPQPHSRAQTASIMMISGGVLLLLVSLFTGEIHDLNLASISTKSWLALAYLVLVCLIGHPAYIWLLSVSSASRVATYAFVNPIVALFLGMLLADETLSLRSVICSVVVISSVMIIVLTGQHRETASVDRTDLSHVTKHVSHRENNSYVG